MNDTEYSKALSDPEVTFGFVCFIRGLYDALGLVIPDEFYHETELPKVLARIEHNGEAK